MSENIETLVDVNPPTPGDEPEESPQLSAANAGEVFTDGETRYPVFR
ncbi:hypothetical protein [Kocuria dechangensis]|nr:hypothetical protein [Kocuria dechangensis]